MHVGLVPRDDDRVALEDLGALGVALLRDRGARVRVRLGRDLLGRALYGLQRISSSLISDKYVRRGTGIFRGSCYPAAF